MKKVISLMLALLMLTTLFLPCVQAKEEKDACTSWGDIDGDGKVAPADARLVLRQSVGLEKYPEEALARCDIDRDDKISSSDARMVLRLSVGLEKFPAHETLAVYGKDATCTEPGLSDGVYCVICEKELVPQEEIPAPGHTVVEDAAVEATCTEDGLTAGSHCSVCETVFEAQEVVPALGHKAVAVPSEDPDTCEEAQVCERCGFEISPERKHTYDAKAVITAEKGVTCDHCGKTIKPSFNDMVNVLKQEEHTFTSFSKSTTTITDTKFTGIMLALKSMFEEEFASSMNEETEYTELKTDEPVNADTYEIFDSDKVSLLTDDDVDSITTKTVESIDFLASMPDSYTTPRGQIFDLTPYKAKATGNLLKVTVKVKPEKYSDVKSGKDTDHIKNVFSSFSSLVNSAMSEFESLDEDFLKCECDCNSTATVTYYFDEATLTPVAALYDVVMDLTQKMDLYITQTGAASKISTGSVSLFIKTTLTNYCFFDDFLA